MPRIKQHQEEKDIFCRQVGLHKDFEFRGTMSNEIMILNNA